MNRPRTPLILIWCLLAVLSVSSVVNRVSAADWSHWRGPEQNGVSREKDLPEKVSLDPNNPENNLLWRSPYGGRSTPIVQNNRVYFVSKIGEEETEQERVVCLDADTGKLIGEDRLNVFLTDIVSSRLGWASMAGDPETGNVYAHGTQGFLSCYDRDLKPLWRRSLTEEFGRASGYGGRLTTPIVDGDLVILGLINAAWGELARGSPRFIALDKRTGDVVWWASTGYPPSELGTYYSSPVVTVIGGQRLLISGGGDGYVHGFKVRTGEKLWSYLVGHSMLNSSPVVAGNLVFIGHGEENPGSSTQGAMLCVDASKVEDGKPKLVWRVEGVKAKYASPVLHEGRIYVADEGGTLVCLDAAKGETLWEKSFGKDAKGSPVWADGRIYATDINSKFVILKPGESNCKVLHSQFFRKKPGGGEVEINGGPAIVNGRIFVLTSDEAVCFGKKGHSAKPDPIPPSPKEEPADKNAKAAHLQVVPADVLLSPGGTAEFKARLFDDKGRFLRETKGKWSLSAMLPPPPLPGVTPPPGDPPPVLKGEVTDAGKLTVDAKAPGQFGNVLVEAEGIKGRARVRVAAVVPYKQDFENVPENRTPAGWINTQGKFTVRKVGDSNVLVKASSARPPLARANAYITAPSTRGYTVECDVLGKGKKTDLLEMGIVANRYTLQLVGSPRLLLRIQSWEGAQRIDESIAANWEPNVWYRLKLTVEVNGGKTMVRGKWWERAKPEPKDWAIEVEDPRPNAEGAAALFADARAAEAEIHYDNVVVTPNK